MDYGYSSASLYSTPSGNTNYNTAYQREKQQFNNGTSQQQQQQGNIQQGGIGGGGGGSGNPSNTVIVANVIISIIHIFIRFRNCLYTQII